MPASGPPDRRPVPGVRRPADNDSRSTAERVTTTDLQCNVSWRSGVMHRRSATAIEEALSAAIFAVK
jgi:hypothetical protein